MDKSSNTFQEFKVEMKQKLNALLLDKIVETKKDVAAQMIGEAGQEVGKVELVKTDVKKARDWAEKEMEANGKSLDEELPNFDKNYEIAKSTAASGKTKRKDMPVIDEKDIKDFQKRLKDGYIDINAPYSDETNPSDPFPEGLTKSTGKNWLEDGLSKHDGDKKDDKVNLKIAKVEVSKLKPIQQQIYFDKSLASIADFGATGSKSFIGGSGTTFIVSADNYIIDGHHRYLSGILLDPKMKVNCMVIDLPIAKLLPASLSYSDAVGNKRNA